MNHQKNKFNNAKAFLAKRGYTVYNKKGRIEVWHPRWKDCSVYSFPKFYQYVQQMSGNSCHRLVKNNSKCSHGGRDRRAWRKFVSNFEDPDNYPVIPHKSSWSNFI